jgi:hypothetical protein
MGCSQATSFVVGHGREESASMLSGMPKRPLKSRDWVLNRITHGCAADFACLMMQA